MSALSSDSYLSGLNEQQREAVLHIDGPLLVLSGAGTGKTTVLTKRMIHIMATGSADSDNILMVTFTNKAAKEMLERVQHMLNTKERFPWLGTFHSIGARILRQHPQEALGITSSFTILSPDDQTRLLKQLMAEENIDSKRYPPLLLASLIDQWKNQGITHARLPESESLKFAAGRGRRMYALYQERLCKLNAVDFGDLILGPVELFMRKPEILKSYQNRFSYILVDEYQDTNTAQYQLLYLLAKEHKNICCVGDDDQSIYSWRGSSIEHILRFEKDFPGAAVIRLEQNYRSTPSILASASHLIAHNKRRLEKSLWTDRPTTAPSLGHEEVVVVQYADNEAEAAGCMRLILKFLKQETPVRSMAVLVRTSFQIRAFEDQFIKNSVPYVVVGGLRFYERKEILDCNAYLRLALNQDDDLAFERIINTPKRALGDVVLHKIRAYAQKHNISLMRSVRSLLLADGDSDLRALARKNLEQFVNMVDVWTNLVPQMSLQNLLRRIIDDTGYVVMLKNSALTQDQDRVDNIFELLRALEHFTDAMEYLESIALIADAEQTPTENCIKIMTLHSAKGLEFDIVFLPGWEEGIFPHQRVLDEQKGSGLEEERRLAYVGITRARRRAYISYVRRRCMYNTWQNSTPSRFLQELPKDHIKEIYAAGPMAPPSSYRRVVAQEEGEANAAFMKKSWVVSQDSAPVTAQHWSAPAEGKFYIGKIVTHKTFGKGCIKEIEGNKLTVEFESGQGRVKVLSSFVHE